MLAPIHHASAMDYVLGYDIEDAWEGDPRHQIYQQLLQQNKTEQAHELQRQALIEHTRTAFEGFMRPQEKRLNDLVMSTIDHAYHNTRGLNLPEHLHDRFLEEFKYQFHTYLINRS